MASIPEERNIILQKNIPKLITSLTGFKPGEENFKLCLQFTWSHVKHHRYLSVNSHEIKRDVEGICDKLKVNNFHDEEKKFRKIIEETFSHELSVNHFEKDIGYSLVSFLIALAYDPITKLKDKKRRGIPIFVKSKEVKEENKFANENFISTLLKDNFDLSSHDFDSDLSEWTESEDDEQKSLEHIEIESQNSTRKSNVSSGLKPPQKMQVFGKHKIENSEKWLKENIQHSWWSLEEVTSQEITSTHPVAHFCEAWQKHLSRKSLGFIKPQPTSLLTEYCLLREIFWMFLNPVECKFFKLEKDEISLRKNVSMPSTSVDSLHTFLQDFVNSMNIFYKLNNSIEKSTKDSSLSHTLENYFSLMQIFLNEIVQFLLAEEDIVKAREETYTILILYNKFRPHSKMLEMLWNIHKSCMIDSQMSHIQTAFLLASLHHQIQNAACKEMKNLCTVFLVTCIKTFLDIFNIWWNEARLQDIKNEFIVEKTSNFDELEIIQVRLFEKNKEKLFFVNDSISKRIVNDSLFTIMNYYAKEASFTLEFISKLDRTHEMRKISGDDELKQTLYENFMEMFQQKVNIFSSEEREIKIEEITNQRSENQLKNQILIDDMKREMLEDDDEMMLLVFNSTFENVTKIKEEIKQKTPLDFYNDLNNSTSSLLMPLENSIQKILKEILEKKISIAEKFVMDIYFNELMIEQKLQEIHKVYFLDSIELINFFSLKVFPLMEMGNNSWANDYYLTTALNEAIGSGGGGGAKQNIPVFTVSVNRKLLYYTVIEAIDEITLHECVNMNHQHNLDFIFTSNVVKKYNDVFRFLLKIKWSQQLLNSLIFPDFFKHRAPYAKLNMLNLVIKRLSLTRFSMLQAINTIHNRLMVMLSGFSHQLDVNIAKTKKITELISHHQTFVENFHSKAFLDEKSIKILGIIIEMLKLAKVIKDEWNNIENFAMLDAAGKIDDSDSLLKLNTNTMEIEKAFKMCENKLKDLLDF